MLAFVPLGSEILHVKANACNSWLFEFDFVVVLKNVYHLVILAKPSEDVFLDLLKSITYQSLDSIFDYEHALECKFVVECLAVSIVFILFEAELLDIRVDWCSGS